MEKKLSYEKLEQRIKELETEAAHHKRVWPAFNGYIIGTGSSVPKRVLANEYFEHIVATSDEWITQRTGIKERHIASTENRETTTDLAIQASLKAVEMAGIRPNDLDMIVVGTVTQDRLFPSTACMVQKALHAENAVSFDISAGCAGFLYSLDTVNKAIRCGSCKNALIVGVERPSTVLDWSERGTCVLMGDGAGAVVLTASEKQDVVFSSQLKSNGNFGDLLYSSHGNSYLPKDIKDIDLKPFQIKMEGAQLFKQATRCLSSIAKDVLQRNSLSIEDIALLIPHQANIRIIKTVAKNLNIPMDKVYANIDKYGNTSSASIPIAIDEANRRGLLKKDTYILFASFGSGLTWGASLIKWLI